LADCNPQDEEEKQNSAYEPLLIDTAHVAQLGFISAASYVTA